MTAHLDRQVPPLRVDNVEMVVINQWPVFRPPQHYLARVIVFGLPDQGRSFGHENGKHPSKLRIQRAKFFGLSMFGLIANHKVAQRNLVFCAHKYARAGQSPQPPCAVVARSALYSEKACSTKSKALRWFAPAESSRVPKCDPHSRRCH